MSQKIIFEDYITRVKVTEGRRPLYFDKGDKLPLRLQTDQFVIKKGRLYDSITKKFVVKNARMVEQPRFKSLSYNAIGARDRITVLVKLKEWMRERMPDEIEVKHPWMIDCTVYDFPIPLEKDLDNMHIYYKAFLDLLKGMGFVKDDSKQYITQAGGFRFTPIEFVSERKLIFSIKEDIRQVVHDHLMFNLEPKVVVRNGKKGWRIVDVNMCLLYVPLKPGEIQLDSKFNTVMCGLGRKKIISNAVTTCFKKLFAYAVNHSTEYWVEPDFYRIHADKIQVELLNRGVPVNINIE